jgi:hypothetical protein
VNNFVTGLVRRSAGLPLPSAVRPALGVAIIPPAEGVSEGSALEQPAEAKVDRGPDAFSPEPASSRLLVANSSPMVSETRPSFEDRPANKEKPLPVQPRMEPFRPSIPDAVPYTAPVIEPGAAPVTDERNLQSPAWQPSLAPRNAEIESGTAPDAVSRPASMQFPEAVDSARAPSELIPRPEPPTASGAAESLPTATASSGPGNAHETRNIKVSIGKVEIRTSQPASVVQSPRPARQSGFDDLRLARTYLDRGAR